MSCLNDDKLKLTLGLRENAPLLVLDCVGLLSPSSPRVLCELDGEMEFLAMEARRLPFLESALLCPSTALPAVLTVLLCRLPLDGARLELHDRDSLLAKPITGHDAAGRSLSLSAVPLLPPEDLSSSSPSDAEPFLKLRGLLTLLSILFRPPCLPCPVSSVPMLPRPRTG